MNAIAYTEESMSTGNATGFWYTHKPSVATTQTFILNRLRGNGSKNDVNFCLVREARLFSWTASAERCRTLMLLDCALRIYVTRGFIM